MINKRLTFLSLFFIFFSLTSIGYFLIYYHLLSFEFSFRTALFVLLFGLCISSMLYISRSLWWRILISLFLACVALLALINYVYIKVYHTFVQVFSSAGNMHTLLETLKEFYGSIPSSLYISTLIFFVISLIYVFWFGEKMHTEFAIIFCDQNIIVNGKKKYVSFMISVISILSIFVGSVVVADHFEKNPRDGWWNHNYMVSDFGIYGYIFLTLRDVIVPYNPGMNTVYATNKQDVQEIQTATVEVEKTKAPETPVDFLKFYLDKLEDFSPTLAVANIGITMPDFTSNTPHILIYQLESVGTWAINHDPSPMPYFKQFITDNIHTQKFFANGCHTIDAELSTLCSFLPDIARPIADVGAKNEYTCLPTILEQEKGYTTAVFHTNDSYFWNRNLLDPRWGFDNLFFAPDYFIDKKLDDSIPLKKAVEFIKKSDKPVLAQVIGYVSHMNHYEEDLKDVENHSKVSIPRFTATIDPELIDRNEDLDEKQMRTYFAYLTAVDNDIKGLFENLEKEQLLDKTIVVIVNDHRLYNFPENDEKNFYLYNEIPFVMYIPGMRSLEVQKIGSHIDIAPTLIDLVFGKEYEDPSNFVGTSLFSTDHANYALSMCLGRVNYVNTNDIIMGSVAANQYIQLNSQGGGDVNEVKKVGNILQTIVNMVKNIIGSNAMVS